MSYVYLVVGHVCPPSVLANSDNSKIIKKSIENNSY